MNPDKEKSPGGREAKPAAESRDDSRKKTPAADMQPEDATEDDAQADARDTGGGTPVDSAMKQQSKTGAGR
jgi:hypothetical protein